MSRANYALWHALEAQVRRVLHLRMSFLKFLCLVVWEEERHVVSRGAAMSVMVRDRGRCSSPVCSRHNVQEHHIVFRSHGGGEEDENKTSPCFPCHLRGIHEGRLSVSTLDGRLRWVIGRVPLMVVEGREKMAA
jgi:5-methylcytosine-specific restriction endonuclease McrA